MTTTRQTQRTRNDEALAEAYTSVSNSSTLLNELSVRTISDVSSPLARRDIGTAYAFSITLRNCEWLVHRTRGAHLPSVRDVVGRLSHERHLP